MPKGQDKNKKNSAKKPRSPEDTVIDILYALFIISVVAYVLTSNSLAGMLSAFFLVVIIVATLRYSIREEGIKKTVKEVIEAVVAVAAVWLILIVALQTTSPVQAVVSCSMLPNLQLGEMLLVHGISNLGYFAAQEKVPIVNVNSSAFNAMLAGMNENLLNDEFLQYYPYVPGNKSAILNTSGIVTDSQVYDVGLYNTKCVDQYIYYHDYSRLYSCYVPVQDQRSNLIRYNYSIGNATISGRQYKIVYTSGITIGNTTIIENYSNPIILYETVPQDYFQSNITIVHRLVAVINVSGSYYALTKGDNNPALDIEFGNYPAAGKNVESYVIAKVPYLGYLKLAFGGADTSGCNQVIER